MTVYVGEAFTPGEADVLRRYFTNPVDQNGGRTSRRRELSVASVDYGATARATLPSTIPPSSGRSSPTCWQQPVRTRG